MRKGLSTTVFVLMLVEMGIVLALCAAQFARGTGDLASGIIGVAAAATFVATVVVWLRQQRRSGAGPDRIAR